MIKGSGVRLRYKEKEGSVCGSEAGQHPSLSSRTKDEDVPTEDLLRLTTANKRYACLPAQGVHGIMPAYGTFAH